KPDTRREREPAEVPGVHHEQSHIRVQMRPLVIRRVERGETGRNAVRKSHVAIAVLGDAVVERTVAILAAESDLVRAGDIRGTGAEERPAGLEILVASTGEVAPQRALI